MFSTPRIYLLSGSNFFVSFVRAHELLQQTRLVFFLAVFVVVFGVVCMCSALLSLVVSLPGMCLCVFLSFVFLG